MSSSSAPQVRCHCKPDDRSACWGDPSYKLGTRRYCLSHFPSANKSQEFSRALKEKLSTKDFNFRGVWFPDEIDLAGFRFETNAVFSWAVFNAKADFSEADFAARANFSHAHFERQADFHSANFRIRANFDDAVFVGRANFGGASFKGTSNFHAAQFRRQANFFAATFHERSTFGNASFGQEVDFRLTNFKNHLRFAQSKSREVFLPGSWPDLREIKLDKPELVSFHSLSLSPNWFIEVNPSKFDFINVEWRRATVQEEVKALSRFKSVQSPYRLLAIACWYLAFNAEENHRYEEASRFRYMAMNARRQSWREGKARFASLFNSLKGKQKGGEKRTLGLKLFWKSFGKDLNPLLWLYWAVSGYGERIARAFMVLVIIAAVFAGAYAKVMRDANGAPIGWRAITYSLSVMTLQKPDPPPASMRVQGLVILETVLGPVQAALLALAIRRKFMR